MRKYVHLAIPALALATAGGAWGQSVPLPQNVNLVPADSSIHIQYDPLDPSEVEFVRVYRSTEPGVRGPQISRAKYWSGADEAHDGLHGFFAQGQLDNGTTYYYTFQSEAPDGTLSTDFTQQYAVTPQLNTSVPVPRYTGNWTNLVPRSPSDYQWDNGNTDEAVDFSIWQASDGTWQIVSCIRNTTYPGGSRLLYRWEGTDLNDSSSWTPQGVFATSDTSVGEVEGRIQAPQVFKEGDTYYMIYNSNGAHLMSSADGKNFTRITDDDGNHQIFPMNRDVTIVDNRDVDGLYYAYYTDNQPGMAMRTSATLTGDWSPASRQVHNGFFESPFVQEHEGLYYLFAPTKVFVDDDLTGWDLPLLIELEEGPFSRLATEVFRDGDQWYMAAYNLGGPEAGISVIPFEFTTVPEPASLSLLGASLVLLLKRRRRIA